MSEVRAQNGQTLGKRDAHEIMRTNEGFPPAFPFGRFFGLSPFALMRDFSNELDRAFQGYGSGPEASGWAPSLTCSCVTERYKSPRSWPASNEMT